MRVRVRMRVRVWMESRVLARQTPALQRGVECVSTAPSPRLSIAEIALSPPRSTS